MQPRTWILACLALGLMSTAPARAHFLFVHIGPLAEAGRAVEVYFSGQAEAGDPRFIDKIAPTQLWVQSQPGRFQPLQVHKGADRLRAHLPETGSVAVVGSLTYGVLARPKQTAFLLRHYPKAVSGSPGQLKLLQRCDKVPLEILATFEGDRIQLAALREGKPVPGAVFETIDADLAGVKLTADSQGKAEWQPKAPGRYSIYTSQFIKAAGEHGGKRYEEIREFATLAFHWPLERQGADPEAVALFEEAIAARAQWKDFPGFEAQITGRIDGRPIEGTVTVSADGDVLVNSEEEAVQPWVVEQLESIVLHRAARTTDRPRPVMRFAEAHDDHPLGRLLLVEGGRFASSYRVKDKQITVVNRHVGSKHMTITILDNERNREGRFLPHSYTLQFWDAATGALQQTETVQNRWHRLGNWDLPAELTVTVASETGLAVRRLTLTGHRLLKSP